jgi:hypothetical protein
MRAKNLILFRSHKCEVSPIGLTSITALELAVALLTTFLALGTLLAAMTTLLTLSAASFLSITLTARSLLTAALLTATLTFFPIICHDAFPPVRNVNCLDCRQVGNPTLIRASLHSFKTDCSD